MPSYAIMSRQVITLLLRHYAIAITPLMIRCLLRRRHTSATTPMLLPLFHCHGMP